MNTNNTTGPRKIPPTPLPFRILRKIFPTLEIVLPSLARYIIVRLFFTPFSFKPKQEEADMLSSGKSFEMNINGNKVVAHSWGEGPLAVLVHGWSGRGMQLRLFVEPLVKNGYRVISFDAPGHGQSEGKESSLIEFKDTIVEIEKQQGKISLGVGHSLGGAALVFAAKEGLVLDRLVTISTPTIPDDIVNEFLKRINASSKMTSAIDDYVFKRTGNHFDYYSVSFNAPYLGSLPVLSFHDHNDREASIDHAYRFRGQHKHLKLIETHELGHNRILKDKEVILKTTEFTQVLQPVV